MWKKLEKTSRVPRKKKGKKDLRKEMLQKEYRRGHKKSNLNKYSGSGLCFLFFWIFFYSKWEGCKLHWVGGYVNSVMYMSMVDRGEPWATMQRQPYTSGASCWAVVSTKLKFKPFCRCDDGCSNNVYLWLCDYRPAFSLLFFCWKSFASVASL